MFESQKLLEDAAAARAAAESTAVAMKSDAKEFEHFRAELRDIELLLKTSLRLWSQNSAQLEQLMSAISDAAKANTTTINNLTGIVADKNQQIATLTQSLNDATTALATERANSSEADAAAQQIAADDAAAQAVIDANKPAQ